jgi:hypothetical protein
VKRLGAFALILAALAIPAYADEFGDVVKSIESRQGIHRTDPHLIGFALFLSNPAVQGSKEGSFKIASFENEGQASGHSLQELDRIITASLNPNWRSFLRFNSRKEGKGSIVYADLSGENMRLMIASIERNEIGVVQTDIEPKDLRRWITNPK